MRHRGALQQLALTIVLGLIASGTESPATGLGSDSANG
jgi:hypothetical protein